MVEHRVAEALRAGDALGEEEHRREEEDGGAERVPLGGAGLRREHRADPAHLARVVVAPRAVGLAALVAEVEVVGADESGERRGWG